MMRSTKSLILSVILVVTVLGGLVNHPTSQAQAISGSGINILYAPTHSDDPALRSAVEAITGGTMNYLDAQTSTPTVTELMGYDCVFTWLNYSYANPIAFGDALAAYVDNGGVVLLGAFTTYTYPNALDGAIMDAGYNPVASTSGGNHFVLGTYNGDGTSLIFDGVASYSTNFPDDSIVLQGNGVADGTLDVGEIAAAYRPDYAVIWVNGLSQSSFSFGDSAQIIANACSIKTPLHPSLDYVNTGEILISAGAPVVPYAAPGEYAQTFTLPADYDGNGFDTYIITGTATVGGATWYSIFMGGVDDLWVPASQVQALR